MTSIAHLSIRRAGTAAACLTGALGLGVLGVANVVPDAPASASPTAVCVGSSCTVTFSTMGTGQTWTVPADVTSESFTLYGAAGGQGAVLAGVGATVSGSLALSTGTTVVVDVGGAGSVEIGGGAGGVNGGGNGTIGGGGGGATDIEVGGSALSDRVLVAGGGGGGAGNGAYLTPDCTINSGGPGGAADHGGTTGEGMNTLSGALGGGGGGGAGTTTFGGGGYGGLASVLTSTDCSDSPSHSVSPGNAGANGALGQGGGGASGAGGGGGGGEFGGGQGGGPATVTVYSASWGGGGGGSSYGGGVTDYALTNDTADVNDGDGEAVVSYIVEAAPPPTVATTSTTTSTTTTTTTVPTTSPTTAHTTPAASVVTPTTIAATPATDPSALAFTGLNVLPLLVSGMSLIFLGAAMVGGVSIRRRKSAPRES